MAAVQFELKARWELYNAPTLRDDGDRRFGGSNFDSMPAAVLKVRPRLRL